MDTPGSRPTSPRWRSLLELRPAPPRRWLFASRASVSMGAPILAGWLAGDVSAGLMAAIGGFTALYGSGRPFLHRAGYLAVVVLAFALAVGLGMAVRGLPLLAVAVVALIAMLATLLCNAWRTGPPGAYMSALAWVAGTVMPAAHLAAADAALLVLGGGAFAWGVQMAGALYRPRGPEREAVRAAAAAVAGYLHAREHDRDRTRQRAAFALHEAWAVLVDQQPVRARNHGRLSQLRAINRGLHLRFAEALGDTGRGRSVRGVTVEAVRRLQAAIDGGGPVPRAEDVPLAHPGRWALVREALQPGSDARRVVLRVGSAALLAGGLGALFHLERAYWAIAAAVLMLHQGFDWRRMLRRSGERLAGTWIGLLLAGAILLLHPQGPWLVLVVMALQFAIEMLVVRNYALAAIFITGAALTIASGGHPVDDPAGYLLARGVDTAVGCAVALLVYRLAPSRPAQARIPLQLVRLLRAVAAVLPHMAAGRSATLQARTARRELQRACFALAQAHEDSLAASSAQRRAAEEAWPTIAAGERLAYRALSTCWTLETLEKEAARDAAAAMFGADGLAHVRSSLAACIDAIDRSAPPPPLPAMPPLFAAEMQDLHGCLSIEPPGPAGWNG